MCFAEVDESRTSKGKSRRSTERSTTWKNSSGRSDTKRNRRSISNVAQKREICRLQEYGYHVQGPMLPDSAGREYYQVNLGRTHIATLGTHSSTPNTIYINQVCTDNDMRPGRPHASDVYISFWYRTLLRDGSLHPPLRRFIFENVEENHLESAVKAIYREARGLRAEPVWKPSREHENFELIQQTLLPKSVAWMLKDYGSSVEMRGMKIRSFEIQLLRRIRSGNPPEFNLCIEIG